MMFKTSTRPLLLCACTCSFAPPLFQVQGENTLLMQLVCANSDNIFSNVHVCKTLNCVHGNCGVSLVVIIQ